MKEGKNGFFIAALGAICDKSKEGVNVLKKFFSIPEKTEEHAYGIYFYKNGERQLVLVDDFFPYDKDNNLFFYSLYGESEIWLPLIQKAWAKFKGGYDKILECTESEIFEALTGMESSRREINKYDRDILWKNLSDSNEFPICARTIKKRLLSFDKLNKLGLNYDYNYILMNAFEDGKKKVKLRDPLYIINNNNNQNNNGIVTIPYDAFLEYFDIIEINYFKNYGEIYQEEEKEISKEESLRCQFFKIINEKKNEVFINLFQKNKENKGNKENKKNKENKINKETAVFSYLMLVKKEQNLKTNKFNYTYVDSITSLNNKGKYESHIALNSVSLEKGEYYICCDINSRFLYHFQHITGYFIRIISKGKMEIENVTKVIGKEERIKIFQESLIDFIEKKSHDDYTLDNNYTATYFNAFFEKDSFPFDIFYFYNIEKKPVEVKLEIVGSKKETFGLYSIYNDDEVSEFEKYLIKEIKPDQKKIILIMNNEYSLIGNNKKEKYLKFEIDRKGHMNKLNPIFDDYNKYKVIKDKSKDKVVVYKIEVINNLGFILGIESKNTKDKREKKNENKNKNETNEEIKLKMKLNSVWLINPNDWGCKDNIEKYFSLKGDEQLVFSMRKISKKEDEKCYALNLDKNKKNNK